MNIIYKMRISEMIGIRIRSKAMCGRVISLSIKDNNFFSYSKQKKIVTPTNSTNKIYNEAKELFNTIWNEVPLRQFSIGISDLLSDDYHQLYLLEEYNEKDEILNK